MTTPDERTRALRWAGEFLTEIQSTPGVDAELKRQAKAILRHYPTSREIKSWARRGVLDGVMPWLAPEEDLNSITQLKGMFGKTGKVIAVEDMNPLSGIIDLKGRKSTDAE